MSLDGRRSPRPFDDGGHVIFVGGQGPVVDRAAAALTRHAPDVDGETTDADGALESLASADCLLASSDLGEWTRVAFVEAVRTRHPTLPVVVVADGPGDVDALLAAGATDVVDSDASEALLTARLRNALARRTAGDGATGADETLAELKQRALDDANLGVVIAEATEDTPTVFANEGFGRLTGYDPSSFVGRNCRVLQGPATEAAPVAAIRDALSTERPVSVVLRNYRQDGTAFWNEVDLEPVTDADGAVTHYLGFQRDVTERVALERELESARESLHGLYAVTTDASLSLSERIERTLALACERLDVSLGFVTRIADDTQRIVHAVGDHPLLQPGEACPLSKSYCRRTLDTEGLLAVVHAAADGDWENDPGYELFGLECYLGGKVRVDDDLYGTLCFADTEPRDEPFTASQTAFVELLTRWVSYELERKRREQELRAATRRFRALFDNPRTFAGVLDPDGTLREANNAARSTLDDPSVALDEPFWEAPWWTPDPGAVETVRTAVDTAAAGEVAPFECAYSHREGSGTVSGAIYPVYGDPDDSVSADRPVVATTGDTADGSDIVSLMVVGSDTTRRTEQAAQLRRQRDRLEEFASVVSHDLRSPLEVARGRLHLYETAGGDEHIRQAMASIDRMSTLIDDLLDLARQGDTVSDPVSTRVTDVAHRAWGTVATAAAGLSVDLDPAFTVDADPSRLRQLFENLFRNAVEHGSPSDGERPLTVRLVGLDDGRRGFAVEDDGVGIAAEDRGHVFDRGFTTNDEGTGFGLAIVARVVEAHGWAVTVTESATGGARFEVVCGP